MWPPVEPVDSRSSQAVSAVTEGEGAQGPGGAQLAHPPCRLGAGPMWILILAVGVQIHWFWALAAMPLRAASAAPSLAACAKGAGAGRGLGRSWRGSLRLRRRRTLTFAARCLEHRRPRGLAPAEALLHFVHRVDVVPGSA